jgi:3-oxoacyl-[acyl-carrier-protein] synthase II
MTTVVVTGIGATSPLGGDVASTWKALLAGESGVTTLEHDWVEKYDLPVTFAGQAKVKAEDVLERQEFKRLDPSAQLALISAREAWADAGAPDVAPERILVDYATGIGGLWTLLDGWDTLREKGPRRVLPMTIPMLMPNAAAAAVSMALGGKGGARTVVSACASGTESIANAYEHLQLGLADVVVAGGTEAVIHPMPIAAFAAMQALSKRNDDPARASRPYDVDRDGFVLGEGAATIILETKEHAEARGAKIYAELAGGGLTSDSYHITHINAHATSTPVGDIAEFHALKAVFGDRIGSIPVSATKAATGHLLGGTGALEAVFTILAIHERTAPPTINLENQDEQIPLDVVTSPRDLGSGPQLAVSNSFGFGGHNAVVAFRSV